MNRLKRLWYRLGIVVWDWAYYPEAHSRNPWRAALRDLANATPKPDAPLPGTGHAQWIADTHPANDPFVTDPRD